MRARFGKCLLDSNARALVRGDEAVHVEPKVLDLLVLLAQNHQRVVSKDELMDTLWPDAVVGDAALSRLVKEARRAVGDSGTEQAVIKTFHGRGFRLIAPVSFVGGAEHSSAPDAATEDSTAHLDTTGAWSERRRAASLGILWLFPEPTNSSFPREKDPLILGRAQGCGTLLFGKDISRRHAELFRDGPLTILRDLSSRNGTYVNGERVAQVPLSPGDVVRVGEWVGVVALRSNAVADSVGGLRAIAPGVLVGARLNAKLAALRNVAESDVPLTLVGQTGTGKSTLARVFHGWNRIADTLIIVRCEARDRDFSLEGELALKVAETAPGMSTVILDCVSELGARAQGELVRLIDERQCSRAQGAPPQKLRFISTTERLLPSSVSDGSLRSDLYARLSAVVFELPPLRERVEEIPPLFMEFLRKHSGGICPPVEARLIERLCLHDWPFNVRELEQVARQLLLSHEQEPLLKATFVMPLLKDFTGSIAEAQ